MLRDITKGFATGIGLLLASALGCDSPSDPEVPIAIELPRSEIAVIPGQIGPGPVRDPNVYVALNIHRNGYDGPVTLSIEAPSPIIAPAPHTFTAFEPFPAQVAIEVPAGTPSGDHEVTFRATAGSLGSVQTSLTVAVRPFLMRLHQSTVKVNRGATNTLSVYFMKVSNASISVSASSPTGGVTIAASPTTSDRAAYLDISASDAASLETQTVTVTASSSGFSEQRQFQIAVQPTPPKREIAFRVCRSRVIHPLLSVAGRYAYANDGEGWTNVVPDQDDMIRFQATERVRLANAFTYHTGLYEGGETVRVIHATSTELEEMQCASASNGSKTYSVSSSNAQSYQLSLGMFKAGHSGLPTGATRSGPHDLIAIGNRAVPAGQEHVVIVRRGVDLPNGSTIALDFAGAEAVVLDSATVTLSAPATGFAAATSYLHTPTTIGAIRSVSSTQALGWYWAIPESHLQPTDVQSVMFGVSSSQSSMSKGAIHYFRSAGALTPTFGPDLAAPTVNIETQTIQLPMQPEYPDLAGVGYYHYIDHRGMYDLVELWQTRGYAGVTEPFWTFTPPDVGRLAYVRPISADPVGAAAVHGPPSAFFGATPSAGTVLQWGIRSAGRFARALPFPSGR